MNKITLLFIYSLLFVPSLWAQEKNGVLTTFYQDGTLYKNQNDFSEAIAEFKENDICTVLDYMGKDIYKVKYEGQLGYVSVDDLEVTEGMMDLYYDYQEKARQKAIEAREQRAKRFAGLIETQKQDSIAKIQAAQQAALVAQRKQDSLAKIKEQERLRLMAEKKADSLAKVKERQLLEKQKRDSIAKIQVAQQAALVAQRKQDSLAKINHKVTLPSSKNQQEATIDTKPEETTRSTDCKYLINEYDDFYNVKTIQTDPYELSENLTIELYRLGRKLNVFFYLSENLGCASYMSHNRSSVKVKLENNQTVSFYHSWGMECGDFTFKGRLYTSQIKRLLSSPIKSILLRGTKSSTEITNITDKYFFIDKLHCLELED